MRSLSKSKLVAFRQCAKRLWLEIHRPDLNAPSASTATSFSVGHQVGEIAQTLYAPRGDGITIAIDPTKLDPAFKQTQSALRLDRPVFEAGFRAEGAHAFADVMLPVSRKGIRKWAMVEVKSSSEVKPYYYDDVAIQATLARAAGVQLARVSVAYVDKMWVYSGGEDYSGLLIEKDLTQEAFARGDEVRQWIADAHRTASKKREPRISTGGHCTSPFACGFIEHCQSQETQAVHPVQWLPNLRTKAVKQFIEDNDVTEMEDVPDALLNPTQRRVKSATLSDKREFKRTAAAQALSKHALPATFLDFEAIRFTVPIWKGTRPYQAIPFQFSVHRVSRTGTVEHRPFLDLSGADPSKRLVDALLAACGKQGPIFVYSGYESRTIKELVYRFPRKARALTALMDRLVDLLPIVEQHFYHPSQQGSWSLKRVLPAMCPGLGYGGLEGVKNGDMAMDAYLEAIAPDTSATRKAQIQSELQDYCALDTYGLVQIWSALSGRSVQG